MVRTRSFFAVVTFIAATVFLLVLPSLASAVPANDNFADAQTISGETDAVDGTNVGATLEAGDPTFVGEWPLYSPTSHTVWYRWTAPFSGQARIDTCASNFNTILGLYTGSALGSLTQLAGSDDDCGLSGSNHGSEVRFHAQEGTIYRILVDGWRSDDGEDDGRQGAFTLELNRTLLTDCPKDRAGCTGTETDDRITGTRSKNFVRAYGGEDRISALGANDVAIGGGGDDVVNGNKGQDRLYGGEGDDFIDTGGLDRDPDSVDCGAGYDVVWRERKADAVARNCEEIYTYYDSGGGY